MNQRTRQERYDFIYGNNAYKMDTAAQPVRRNEPVRKPARQSSTIGDAAVKRNQRRELAFDKGFVLTLAIAIVMIVATSMIYLSRQTKIESQRSAVASKQEQLNTLVTENEDLSLEIEQKINLSEVRERAIAYGMKKPTSKQIITYNSKSLDYVRQYGAIPKAN